MPPAVSGILLAGGASSRFGRDKLVESVGGHPLFQLPLAALAAVCDEVVLVVGPDAEPPALPPSPVPIRIARDERRHEGPLVAASVGLAAVGGAFALIAAGDMPGLRREGARPPGGAAPPERGRGALGRRGARRPAPPPRPGG